MQVNSGAPVQQYSTSNLVSPPKSKISFNITPSAYGQSSPSVLVSRVNSPLPPSNMIPQPKITPQSPRSSTFNSPYPLNIQTRNQFLVQ